jgi:hypothetical protein
MSILRSRIESRVGVVLGTGGNAESAQELGRLLELVKNGELILKEMSDKVESARFLEEFVQIINGASESVNEIREDVEELVPIAEAALTEMHDAITHVSTVLSEPREEGDPTIFAQISAELAAISIPSTPPKTTTALPAVPTGNRGSRPQAALPPEEGERGGEEKEERAEQGLEEEVAI